MKARKLAVPEDDMCQHQPQCPDALAPDRTAARVAVAHPEQGWSLLCNGVQEPTAEELAAEEMVRRIREQGLSLPARTGC